MDVTRTSDPLTQTQKLAVVTLDEAKMQARVTFPDHDELIRGYIETAFDFLHGREGWLNGYCLLEETYEAYLPVAGAEIELPLRPVIGFDDLTFNARGPGGVYAPVAADLYGTSLRDTWGLISRGTRAYPSIDANPRAYRVVFKAGHAQASDVPSPIRLAIKMLVTHWYENRGATMPDTRVATISRQVEFGLRALAGRYRVSVDHS